jgi:FtsP/CotA-like multicopper oxidase with cupredoxin domain
MLIRPTRRNFLSLAAAAPIAASAGPLWAQSRELLIESRQIEVLGRAATVYGFTGPDGKSGFSGKQGDRFDLSVRNNTGAGVVTHWHGQVMAAEGQDRSYTGGGELAPGAVDSPDFALTPGTHWMHSHQLTEQQLMAAPMICREADAEDIQEHVVMLHDFSFMSPEEILAGLGASMAHGAGHGPSEPPLVCRRLITSYHATISNVLNCA